MGYEIKRPFGGYVKFMNILTKEFLVKEHIENKKSLNEIAKLVGCSFKTVSIYLNYHNIERHYYSKLYPCSKKSFNWKGYEEISSTYWNNLKNGAKTRNIDFCITPEDVWNLYLKQNKKCVLSGQLIGFERCKNNTASLDRINPTKPYVLENVQWVHRDINFAKQSMNNEEFISMCKKVSIFNS